MVKWIKRLLMLIVILAVLAGSVYALDWLGVFKFQNLLVKIPGGAKIIALTTKEVPVQGNKQKSPVGKPGVSKSGESTTTDNLVQQENQKLKVQVKDLQKQLEALKVENKAQVQKQQELEQQLISQSDNVNNTDESDSGTESSYKQLAKYYAEMKPKEAVAIMDKLDDDTVIGILINLENEQTAKILATMDPKRAARLVNKLAL